MIPEVLLAITTALDIDPTFNIPIRYLPSSCINSTGAAAVPNEPLCCPPNYFCLPNTSTCTSFSNILDNNLLQKSCTFFPTYNSSAYEFSKTVRRSLPSLSSSISTSSSTITTTTTTTTIVTPSLSFSSSLLSTTSKSANSTATSSRPFLQNSPSPTNTHSSNHRTTKTKYLIIWPTTIVGLCLLITLILCLKRRHRLRRQSRMSPASPNAASTGNPNTTQPRAPAMQQRRRPSVHRAPGSDPADPELPSYADHRRSRRLVWTAAQGARDESGSGNGNDSGAGNTNTNANPTTNTTTPTTRLWSRPHTPIPALTALRAWGTRSSSTRRQQREQQREQQHQREQNAQAEQAALEAMGLWGVPPPKYERVETPTPRNTPGGTPRGGTPRGSWIGAVRERERDRERDRERGGSSLALGASANANANAVAVGGGGAGGAGSNSGAAGGNSGAVDGNSGDSENAVANADMEDPRGSNGGREEGTS